MNLKWQLKIIDLYLFKQVLYPFLLGIFLATIILLSTILYDLTDWLIIESVPLSVILEYLAYKLPETVVETFPIGILFGTIYGLGRLNQKKEITALRMGGISLFRVILPLTILGIMVSLFTYGLNEHVVPHTNQRAHNIYQSHILQNSTGDVQEDIYFEDNGRLFHAGIYNQETAEINNILILNDSHQNKYPRALTAPEGSVRENIWLLKEGKIHSYNQEGFLEAVDNFEEMEIEISRDFTALYGQQQSGGQMSLEEIRNRIQISEMGGAPTSSLLVDYHLELATSFAPLILLWIGAPLSLGKEKGRATSIMLTIIIIFLYYILQSTLASLGRNNIINPILSAWFPHLFFLLVGGFLLFQQKFK